MIFRMLPLAGELQSCYDFLSMKIFIGPYEVAGYYSNLADGMRKLGLDVDYFVYKQHKYKYETDQAPKLLKVIQDLYKIRDNKVSYMSKIGFTLIIELLKLIWLFYSLYKYDVFIFGYGRSLLIWNIDLPILYLARKKIVMNLAHGSEARPPFLDGFYSRPKNLSYSDYKDIYRRAKRMKNSIDRIEKYSTHVLGNPLSSSYYLKKPFINAFKIGTISKVPSEVDSRTENNMKHQVRIVHAPSNREAKGTELIVKCIKRLQQADKNIQLVLLENLPNSEILNHLSQCDFVIDQLYSDTPLSGIAIEAAMFRKPTLVAGYAATHLEEVIDTASFPPSLYCHPNELEPSLLKLINDANLRKEIGDNAYEHLKNHSNARAVASRYKMIIESGIPSDWFYDPARISYHYGAGQSQQRTKEIVQGLILNFSIRGLFLDDKKEIQMSLAKMIED